MKKIFFDDTTLRDGEQTPGVILKIKDKLEIAKALEVLGVDEIEAGFPASGNYAMKSFEAVMNLNLKPRIIAFNRCMIEDVSKSISAGANSVELSLPVSDSHISKKLNKDRIWVIETLKKVLAYCKDKGLYVSVGAEDSSRSDIKFLIEYFKTAEKYGADRVRFCDTVGILDPFSTFEMIKKIKEYLLIPIEFHGHNDLGMATANAFAAVKAGAEYLNTTILGLGERAGNTAIEEISMALFLYKEKYISIDVSLLKYICELVSKITNFYINKNKPIFGENVFTHESGMHVDGVLKDPNLYEPFDPLIINKERRITMGPTSGRANLVHFLEQKGKKITKKQIEWDSFEKIKFGEVKNLY